MTIKTTTKTISARKRIKLHLRRRGEELLDTSPSCVLHWWYQLNHAIFGGILHPPKRIMCRNFQDGTLGWISPIAQTNNVVMGIRRQLEDRKQFITILAHEMVHQYEWVYHRRMSHGQTFYEWAPLIKRELNLPLMEYIDD